MIGQTISHYRIIEKIGGGGMGVVFKAEDLKLGRAVALKFLPPELTQDKEAQQRFIREAKAASALDHPNVCNIHEIDATEDGQTFIVMAFYEGETLDKIIDRGPLPLNKALEYATQIALGLTRAHVEGIAHRDIKPANIILSKEVAGASGDSRIKIVDFGLAAIAGATKLTQTGATLGTVSYMSPEQARGQDSDARSDIWSLGVVLYEMLTGKVPFRGDYPEAVLYSVMNEEPDPPTGLRTGIPIELDRVVAKALSKRPEERYQHMDEMLVDLTKLRQRETPLEATVVGKQNGKRKWKMLVVGGLGVIALAVFALLVFLWDSDAPKEPPIFSQLTSLPNRECMPSFSPDGSSIVFSWNGEEGDNWNIYVMQIDVPTDEIRRLTTDPRKEVAPAWSPDGRHVAFIRESPDGIGIYRIAAMGGQEQLLDTLSMRSNLSWFPDSESLLFVDRDSVGASAAVYQLSIETLQRKKLTHPPIELHDLYAAISPDGKRLAFARGLDEELSSTAMTGTMPNRNMDIYVARLDGGEEKPLTNDRSTITGLTWSHDNQDIVYSSDRLSGSSNLRLWRMPINGDQPEQLITRGDRIFHPVVSRDGMKLAYTEVNLATRGIYRATFAEGDTTGMQLERLTEPSARDESPQYSPDGDRIVFASNRSLYDEIWVCDRDGGNPRQLTNLRGPRTGTPRWHPDGRQIAFDSYDGKGSIYVKSVVAAGSPIKVTPDSLDARTPFWSADGLSIYFNVDWKEIWKVSKDGGQATQVTNRGGTNPKVSPDGKWLYYFKDSYPRRTVWRKPVLGGDESLVMDNFSGNGWGGWVVFDDGSYYMEPSIDQGYLVKYIDLDSSTSRIIGHLDAGYYIDVSPNRKHLIMSYPTGTESVDLAMIENWR